MIAIKEEDDDLIELMGLKDDFPDEAREAYGKLFQSCWKPMFAIAMKVCSGRKNQLEDAEDLVADTFNKVCENAGSFKKNRKLQDKLRRRSAVLSWIKTIMKNVFYDLYLDDDIKERIKKEKAGIVDDSSELILPAKKRVLKNHFQDEHDNFIDELELEENQRGSVELNGTNPEVESHNEKIVYDHLQKLSERNADIVRTVYNYYVEGKNTPTEVLDDLESRWGTSRSNIRMILKNFNDSIGQQISSEIRLRVTK
jgi:RNA polymerase sigma factor (sigma-70 family)